MLVNVTVQSLAPCKKLMRVEIEAQKVDETFEAVATDFRREAKLPGFRPGKAPREMVLRKYEKEIQDETKRKLISEAYRQAVEPLLKYPGWVSLPGAIYAPSPILWPAPGPRATR